MRTKTGENGDSSRRIGRTRRKRLSSLMGFYVCVQKDGNSGMRRGKAPQQHSACTSSAAVLAGTTDTCSKKKRKATNIELQRINYVLQSIVAKLSLKITKINQNERVYLSSTGLLQTLDDLFLDL